MSADWLKNYDSEPIKLMEMESSEKSEYVGSITTVFFWVAVFVVLYLAS